MADNIEWKSVDVIHTEGMTVRVGAFRSMDGTVAEFTPPIIQKMFAKITKPIPIYYTHDGAGNILTTRVPLGYAVKFGIDPMSHSLLYQAFLFDEDTKKYIFAEGCDCTSAEVDFEINDLTKMPTDATLNGIAIVPIPAIKGTDMKVSAVAFSKSKELPHGGDNVTAKAFTSKSGIEKALLEKGFTPDEVEGLFAGTQDYFAKRSNEAKLMADMEVQGKAFTDLQAKHTELEAKYADATKTIETHLSEKLTGLIGEIKTAGFEAPETLIQGMDVPTGLKVLGQFKENLAKTPITQKTDLSKAKDETATDANKVFAEVAAELGVTDQIGKYMKQKVV